MPYVEGAALLGGYTALLAGVALRDAARRGYFDGVHPEARAELLAAITHLERAGRAWQARHQTDGNPETPPAETAPTFPISADQAAALLQVTARRVRQLAPMLGGGKTGGRWTFDRDAVIAERQRRRERGSGHQGPAP